MKEIGLKPSVKIPLINGNLECSLREYVMFDGAYSQFRADGGSVASEASEKRKAEGPRKVRHISDDDWKKESRKFNRDNGMKDRKKDRNPHKHDRDFKHGVGNFRDRDDDFAADERNFERSNRTFERKERDFNRKDRNFERNDRGFSGNNRGSERGERNFDRNKKNFDRKDARGSGGPSSTYSPKNSKGPRLPKESENVINPVYFRKRKSDS